MLIKMRNTLAARDDLKAKNVRRLSVHVLGLVKREEDSVP